MTLIIIIIIITIVIITIITQHYLEQVRCRG